jgi:tetratricopeptide (TPR) repeat protein
MAQDTHARAVEDATAAFRANNFADAESNFQKALRLAETDRQKARAWYSLGVVAQRQNRLVDAKDSALRALALDPQHQQAPGLIAELSAAPHIKQSGSAPSQKPRAPTPSNTRPTAEPQIAQAAKTPGKTTKTALLKALYDPITDLVRNGKYRDAIYLAEKARNIISAALPDDQIANAEIIATLASLHTNVDGSVLT